MNNKIKLVRNDMQLTIEFFRYQYESLIYQTYVELQKVVSVKITINRNRIIFEDLG